MPPAGYPAFLQYLQSGRVRTVPSVHLRPPGPQPSWPGHPHPSLLPKPVTISATRRRGPSGPTPPTAPMPRTNGHWHPSHGRVLRRVSWRPGRRCVRPAPGPSGPTLSTAPMPRTSGHWHPSHGRDASASVLAAWPQMRAASVGSIRPATVRQRRCQGRAGTGIRLTAECFGECLGGLAADAYGLGRVHPARHSDSADAKDERARASVSRPSASASVLAACAGSIRPATSDSADAKDKRALASVSRPSASASILAAWPQMRAASVGSIRPATADSPDAKDERARHSSHGPVLRRVSWRPGADARPRSGPSGPPHPTAPMPRTSGHRHPSHGRVLRRVSWRRYSDRFVPKLQSAASSTSCAGQGSSRPVPG